MKTKVRNRPVYRKRRGIQKGKNGPQKGRSLDTLAQLGTNHVNRGLADHVDNDFTVSGGTCKENKKQLQKKARRKAFTSHLMPGLVTAAERSDTILDLTKGYWRSYHCCTELTVDASGKVRSEYCKQRWCMVCNSIRTAKNIIRYAPIVSSWGDDVYFVTLTEKNCKGDCLRDRIGRMQKIFTQIKDCLRRRLRRSKSTTDRLTGIRKIECTHNSKTNEYNPHFHLILRNADHAQFIVNEWIKRNVYAQRLGQDIRKAKGDSLIELFKYMTKVVTRTDNRSIQINYRSLDVIFKALRRKRTVQPFGFVASKGEEEEQEVDATAVSAVYTWVNDMYDWVDESTGEVLSEYTPSEEFKKFLQGYK